LIIGSKQRRMIWNQRRRFSSISDMTGVCSSVIIKTRYPDYKFEFYKKCTSVFTLDAFTKIKELYQWLLQQM